VNLLLLSIRSDRLEATIKTRFPFFFIALIAAILACEQSPTGKLPVIKSLEVSPTWGYSDFTAKLKVSGHSEIASLRCDILKPNADYQMQYSELLPTSYAEKVIDFSLSVPTTPGNYILYCSVSDITNLSAVESHKEVDFTVAEPPALPPSAEPPAAPPPPTEPPATPPPSAPELTNPVFTMNGTFWKNFIQNVTVNKVTVNEKGTIQINVNLTTGAASGSFIGEGSVTFNTCNGDANLYYGYNYAGSLTGTINPMTGEVSLTGTAKGTHDRVPVVDYCGPPLELTEEPPGPIDPFEMTFTGVIDIVNHTGQGTISQQYDPIYTLDSSWSIVK
jgi:hypothetical protein